MILLNSQTYQSEGKLFYVGIHSALKEFYVTYDYDKAPDFDFKEAEKLVNTAEFKAIIADYNRKQGRDGNYLLKASLFSKETFNPDNELGILKKLMNVSTIEYNGEYYINPKLELQLFDK